MSIEFVLFQYFKFKDRLLEMNESVSKLTVSQNCSIFNNLKGLDHHMLSPFSNFEITLNLMVMN